MKFLISVTIICLFVLTPINGKVFEVCELAKTLKTFGLSKIPDWVCLVEHESSFRTGVTGGPNSDGSFDYGLFQINDRYWCKPGHPGGECNIDCNKFLDDDISDDVKCVNLIYKIHGFNAWYGWVNKCQGNLPDINHCF